MWSMKKKIMIPTVEFEVVSGMKDTRFKRVKIWIAHTGENLNASAFSEDALLRLAESLPYTPIVGFIEPTSDGKKDDFSDHRAQLVITDDDMKYEYLGHAYGVIPAEPNAQIEERDGKTWLTAEGYLWTKFADAIDIFEDNEKKRSQSMEIEVLDGFVDDDGVYHIEDGLFSGLCILGDEHPPAMEGSTIEFYTNGKKNSNKDIGLAFAEFMAKGDVGVEKEKIYVEVLDVKQPVEGDTVIEGTTDAGAVVEVTIGEELKTQEATDGEFAVEISALEAEQEVHVKATLTDEEGETTEKETTLVVEALEEEPEEQPEEPVENDEFSEYALKLEEQIKEQKSELEELRKFKAEIEREAKLNVLEGYTSELSDEAYEEIKENIDNFATLEDVEREVAYKIFLQQKEAKAKETKTDDTLEKTNYSFFTKRQDSVFGDLDKFFY